MPADPRELVDQLEGAEIVSADLSEDGNVLILQLSGDYPIGRFAVQISAVDRSNHEIDRAPMLKIDDAEPAGFGADPYGRPDPIKHPKAWTE